MSKSVIEHHPTRALERIGITAADQQERNISFHGWRHFLNSLMRFAEVADAKGSVVANQEWMFAPWYGDRPDDKAFLEEDKKRPDAVSATQADAQGPHETIIRAGEERIQPTPLPQGTWATLSETRCRSFW